MSDKDNELYKKLNYRFQNEELLELALTHRSVNSSNNERLEYLGDAVLGFIVAEILFQKFPHASEGILTRKRAYLVKKPTLAQIAKKLQLGEDILLGEGEKKSGGWRRDSILSNTLEAIIGAIYLDSDFERCRQFIQEIYSELLENLNLNDESKDPKTELQEYLQARKLPLPVYKVLMEEGEAHDRIFTVSCQLATVEEYIQATGKSKRAAEQAAAEKALTATRLTHE